MLKVILNIDILNKLYIINWNKNLFSTVKAFVVTPPKMTQNSIIFREGVTTKAINFFIADENLFVCILIYFNKNINSQWITIKCKNYQIKFSLKYNFY